MKNSKYLKKLMLFGLTIGIIPVIALGIFSTYRSSTIIQNKVNELNMQSLLQNQMRVEQALQTIHSNYMAIANSPVITANVFSDVDISDYEVVKNIQNSLNGMLNIDSNIKNVYYANIDKDWVVGNSGFGEVNKFFNKDELISVLNNNNNAFWFYNTFKNNIFTLNPNETYAEGDGVCLVIKVPYNLLNKPMGAIIVNISGYQFRNTVYDKERLGEMIIFDKEYNKISSVGDSIVKDYSQLILQISDMNLKQGYYKTWIDGKQVGINYRQSDYNNWTYATIYSISEITRDSRDIGLVTFLLCFITALVVLIITWFSSKRIYSPVGKIYTAIAKTMGINETQAVDELSYIDDSFNVLMKDKDRLMEKMQTQMLHLEELFIMRLLQGEIQDTEIESNIKRSNSSFKYECYSVISIQIDSFESSGFNETDRDLMLLSIKNIVTELLGRENSLQPILIKNTISLIVGYSDEEPEVVRKLDVLAENIKDKVFELLSIVISIGMSSLYNYIGNTAIAYYESVNTLNNRLYLGQGIIMHYENLQPDKYIKHMYPAQLQLKLIETINSGDILAADIALDNIIDDFIAQEIEWKELQIWFARLLMSIIEAIDASGESVNSIIDDRTFIFSELNSYNSIQEVREWFKFKIIHPTIQQLEQQRDSRYKFILNQVLNIIHTQYDKDLTLEMCADKLNYHPSYIWRILKKEMNINFSEYLAKYRLEAAKRWLEDSNMSIAEIAEKLRYNNSQNFIRYFKKLEGMTPGQYREKYREDTKKQ